MIELDTGQDLRDLGAGEADIALRSAIGAPGRRRCRPPPLRSTIGRFTAAAIMPPRHGVPTTARELKRACLHRRRRRQSLARLFGLAATTSGSRTRSRCTTHRRSGLLAAIRSGFGIAVLPCIVADARPRPGPLPSRRRDGHGRVMWLLTHERVRHTPRVRAVIDFLYDGLRTCAGAGGEAHARRLSHSTVTLFARLRGWSTSVPLSTAT